MEPTRSITPTELKEIAREICTNRTLADHPCWQAAEKIEALEKDNRDLRREVAAWRGA